MKKGKKIYFPENVDANYGVIFGLTLKELLLYIAPTLIIGLVIVAIPPHSIVFIFIKAFVVIVIITIVLASLAARPVKNRPNIRYSQYLDLRKQYRNRQKLFYIQRKRKKPF